MFPNPDISRNQTSVNKASDAESSHFIGKQAFEEAPWLEVIQRANARRRLYMNQRSGTILQAASGRYHRLDSGEVSPRKRRGKQGQSEVEV